MTTAIGIAGTTMPVRNVGAYVIPAHRFCLSADSGSDADDSPGFVVGASTSPWQLGSGSPISAYAAVKRIIGEPAGTGETGKVMGVTASAIMPGHVGTITVSGPALVEVDNGEFDVEVQEPVQAHNESDDEPFLGVAQAVEDGVSVGVVIRKVFESNAQFMDFVADGSAATRYFIVVDVFNRTALGLETDTLPI